MFIMIFKDGVLWIGGRGFGIPDDDYLMLLDEINQPEYQAIDAEIHARQTVFKTDISAATVTIPAQAWTGSFVTPTVTVKLGGKTLKAGTDYIATSIYSEPGTAYAVIVGIGHVIQQTAEKPRADLFAERGEGDHPYEIGGERHHGDVDNDAHDTASSSSSSSFTGKSSAQSTEAVSAQRIMEKPLVICGSR